MWGVIVGCLGLYVCGCCFCMLLVRVFGWFALLDVVGLFCRYGVVGVRLIACYCGNCFGVFV